MSLKKIFSFLVLCFFCTELLSTPSQGVFKKNDPRLEGLIWGNWGSRPYEYYWAKEIVDVEGKKVIDLGIGPPSQYNWYSYVVRELSPSYYLGIDCCKRMAKEEQEGATYSLKFMDMSAIEADERSFDVAYCISTFEHIDYDIFIKCIQETHRVLTDEGVLVITLDEQWDKNLPRTRDNGWNDLEISLIKKNLFNRKDSRLSFSLPNFLNLIKEYFVLFDDDAIVDVKNQVIFSKTDPKKFYYNRKNRDSTILVSPEVYNSSVSFAILKKAS